MVRKDQEDKLNKIPEEPEAPEDEGPQVFEETLGETPAPAEKETKAEEVVRPTESKRGPKAKAKLTKNRRQKIAAQSPAPKRVPKAAPEEETTGSGLPEWAKAHTDTWRQPDIFKPRKNIKVHNYAEDLESAEGGKLPLKAKPNKKEEKPPEPNYWGGRL